MSTPQQRRQARTERARQWFLPLLVTTVLLGLWQAWTVIQQVPTYLVPSPWAIAQTLVEDWALLIGSLWVTVKITVLSFVVAVVIGVLYGATAGFAGGKTDEVMMRVAADENLHQLFYRDLDNAIQIGSENGRRYIVFGFSQVMASEQLVEDVVAQLLKNGFGVERLLSDSEQHYIRISWGTAAPSRLSAG